MRVTASAETQDQARKTETNTGTEAAGSQEFQLSILKKGCLWS